jgi:hypothetical protein
VLEFDIKNNSWTSKPVEMKTDFLPYSRTVSLPYSNDLINMGGLEQGQIISNSDELSFSNNANLLTEMD